jgi:hypothetical protein
MFTPLPTRPLGPVTAVLRTVVTEAQRRDAQVPCAGCTACCRANYVVDLTPAEATRLPHSVAADGTATLARHPNGTCVLLGEAGCTIHAERPASCRAYDCRLFALTEVTPPRLLAHGYVPFAVTVATPQDALLFRALRSAAMHLSKRSPLPPEGLAVAALYSLPYFVARREP